MSVAFYPVASKNEADGADARGGHAGWDRVRQAERDRDYFKLSGLSEATRVGDWPIASKDPAVDVAFFPSSGHESPPLVVTFYSFSTASGCQQTFVKWFRLRIGNPKTLTPRRG